MTDKIKPNQCGIDAWYIPNQNGLVPETNGEFWFCTYSGKVYQTNYRDAYYYALIEVGNCFETKKEALDAFVKPVDPTPLTWDELCEMEAAGGYPYTLGRVSKFNHSMGSYVYEMCVNTERADEIRLGGKILFAANKYWRSKESLEAWIEKQKGE